MLGGVDESFKTHRDGLGIRIIEVHHVFVANKLLEYVTVRIFKYQSRVRNYGGRLLSAACGKSIFQRISAVTDFGYSLLGDAAFDRNTRRMELSLSPPRCFSPI